MKNILLLCSVLLSATAFSQSQTDSLKIIHLIQSDYKTLASWDSAAHVANCAPDYLLIENGDIWDMQKELLFFKKNRVRKITRSDTFQWKAMHVLGEAAYVVYSLHAVVTEGDTEKVYDWNESAVLRKMNGAWKIALIHSTPIKPK